jgi:hypothetical protein
MAIIHGQKGGELKVAFGTIDTKAASHLIAGLGFKPARVVYVSNSLTISPSVLFSFVWLEPDGITISGRRGDRVDSATTAIFSIASTSFQEDGFTLKSTGGRDYPIGRWWANGE